MKPKAVILKTTKRNALASSLKWIGGIYLIMKTVPSVKSSKNSVGAKLKT